MVWQGESFWSSWRWWLPLVVVCIVLSLIFVDPFIGDWDGLDYTVLSLRGYPSSMALGRGLFIFGNHVLFVAAHSLVGLGPENAYLLFKYAVMAQAPLAVLACWILARDLTHSLSGATVAALLLIFSPVFVIYSGQVMTDVPAVLLSSLALVVHLRGLHTGRIWLVLVGAALLGLGVNLRETVAFFVPWLIVAPAVCGGQMRRRELLLIALSIAIFALFAFGAFTYWFLDPTYHQAWYGWRESMAQEAARHPVGIRNILPFFTYLFVASPLAILSLPFALRKEWRENRWSPLLIMAFTGVFVDALLLFNYSTAIVWRYPLAALPALVPLSGDYLYRVARQRLHSLKAALCACTGAIALLAVLFGLFVRPVTRQFIQWRAESKNYLSQLISLPRDAVVISGAQTVAVTYWRGIGAGNWEVIGTGGGWPGDRLEPLIRNYLQQGRRVFIDADARWWLVCGWQKEEIPQLVKLRAHFNFRHTQGTIYEVRPPEDSSARDEPHLDQLLPENRPEDVKRCPLRPGV